MAIIRSVIWSEGELYHIAEYESEQELEQAILQVQASLFGQNRIYLDVKKKIGIRGSQQNIPDGYLIDLNGKKPRLYVVENELAAHDPLRHIAVQILQFSLSFEEDARTVRSIVFETIHRSLYAKQKCEAYAQKSGFRNLDHLIDVMVFDSPFKALVIIDEIPEKLEKILAERFKFGVEVLALSRYQNLGGHYIYQFEPFLVDIIPADEIGNLTNSTAIIELEADEIDTVVVPAHREGFERTFLGENCWHAVRIHGTVRPQIKYIAVYQIRPVSAITHIAPVKSIEPYGDDGKYILYFSEPAQSVEPIKMVKGGKIKSFQNLRYTTLHRLQNAKTLDDLFYLE